MVHDVKLGRIYRCQKVGIDWTGFVAWRHILETFSLPVSGRVTDLMQNDVNLS
jgi:hypothetical protein